ncbi:MAG TPA: hypothetical protein VKQ30_23250 [Ktedonobacterales bacterium]|nr:hypothetical protein [Ktedonobacterales bacterium]
MASEYALIPPLPERLDWNELDKRCTRAVQHLRCALADIAEIAATYGNQFGALARPTDAELCTRRASTSMQLLRDTARGHARQQARETKRLSDTPLWLLGRDIPDCDTARLDPRSVQQHPQHPQHSHPPPVQRAPHQTGRMRIVEEMDHLSAPRPDGTKYPPF